MSHSVVGSDPINVCQYVCKYVSQKGSSVILTTKKPVGIISVVNLRYPLHAGDKECKPERSTLALQSRQMSASVQIRVISGPQTSKEGLCPPNFFKKLPMEIMSNWCLLRLVNISFDK